MNLTAAILNHILNNVASEAATGIYSICTMVKITILIVCKIPGLPIRSCGTGSAGISSCVDLTDGDYQSCTTCHGFAACTAGVLIVMPCADDLVYDANEKQCDYTSSTCTGPDF